MPRRRGVGDRTRRHKDQHCDDPGEYSEAPQGIQSHFRMLVNRASRFAEFGSPTRTRDVDGRAETEVV